MLLHYQEELSAVEIARRKGISAANVRAQLARARETLRTRLDRRFGDRREGWAVLALLRVVPELAPAAAAGWIGGGLAMNVTAKIGLGVCAALVAGWLIVESVGGFEAHRGADADTVAEADPVATVPEVTPPPEVSEDLSTAREPVASPTPADAEKAIVPALSPVLAHVRGRLLLPGGTPAAGTLVELHGNEGNDERTREFGMPGNWQNLNVVCDAEGRFDLGFDPPRAFAFDVAARASSCAPIEWSWYEILPGAVKDVGEVQFERAGGIRGRIVGPDGAPLALEWSVTAQAMVKPGENRSYPRSSFQADPASAQFHLDGLPPGKVKLSAFTPLTGWFDGPVVDVTSGGEVETVIHYTGPDVSRLLTVNVQTFPFGDEQVEPSAIHLLRENAENATARRVEHHSTLYSFSDLAPGPYSIVIEDERFLPWRRDGVEPGQQIDARLKGSAAIELVVRDRASGASLPRYQLGVMFTDGDRKSRLILIQDSNVDAPAGGLFEGLIPRPCSLRIEAGGYVRADVDVPDLHPGERRVLAVDLDPATKLAGTVTWADGRPAEGVSVELHAGSLSAEDLSDGFFRVQLRIQGKQPAKCSTNAAGGFSFDHVGRGEWTVWASANAAAHALRRLAIAEEEPEPLELTLPAAGSLRGRVLAPANVDLSGMHVTAVPLASFEKGKGEILNSEYDAEVQDELDAEGRFHLEILPLGELVILLRYPDVQLPTRHGTEGAGGGGIELGSLTLESAVEVERDFDIGSQAPGRLLIEASLDGQPATSAVAELYCVEQPSYMPLGGAALDSTGTALAEPLQPGKWRLVLRDVEKNWRYIQPGAIEIEAGCETRVQVTTTLVPGRVEILTSDGVPLANSQVGWICESEGFFLDGSFNTDLHGIAELSLPAGTYRFDPTSQNDSAAPVVEWTSDGPHPATIELTRGR
jgi:hypothetical protein